jgi:hypothetical protein
MKAQMSEFSAPSEQVRQQALQSLTNQLVEKGHPQQYAQHMAAATIFQADLELRNAQLSRLLSWLKENYPEVHAQGLDLVEQTREEFEKRVQEG